MPPVRLLAVDRSAVQREQLLSSAIDSDVISQQYRKVQRSNGNHKTPMWIRSAGD